MIGIKVKTSSCSCTVVTLCLLCDSATKEGVCGWCAILYRNVCSTAVYQYLDISIQHSIDSCRRSTTARRVSPHLVVRKEGSEWKHGWTKELLECKHRERKEPEREQRFLHSRAQKASPHLALRSEGSSASRRSEAHQRLLPRPPSPPCFF